MGFYIRKSKSFGPFRLNLSKSGLGVSAGIKGVRISTGPRGTFLHAGQNGLYYRKKIGNSSTNSKNKAINQAKIPHTAAEYRKQYSQEKKASNKQKGDWLYIVGIIMVICAFYQMFANGIITFLVSIQIIIMASLALISYGIGNSNLNKSLINFGQGQFIITLITILCASLVSNEVSPLNKTRIIAVFTIILLLAIIIMLIIVYKNSIKNYINKQSDLIAQKIQLINVLPSIILLLAYIMFVFTVYGTIIESRLLKQVCFILFTITIILYFLVLISSVKIDYELTNEEKKKWNSFVDNLELLLDCDKVFALYSSENNYDSVYDHPTRIEVLVENKKSFVKTSIDFRTIQFVANGKKISFLPDRIVVSDYMYTESFYYADLVMLDGQDTTTLDKNKIGNDVYLSSIDYLYENKDGTRDRRRKYNPTIAFYEMPYFILSDDNFWLKIAISRKEVSQLVIAGVKDYLKYSKECKNNLVLKESLSIINNNSEEEKIKSNKDYEYVEEDKLTNESLYNSSSIGNGINKKQKNDLLDDVFSNTNFKV